MTVTITDFRKSLTAARRFDHVIGILDIKMRREWESKLKEVPNRHMFWFEDNLDGFGAPKLEDALDIHQCILDNDMHNPEKSVMVHCVAGIGRSVATAIALMIMRGHTIDEAFRIAQKQRPEMWPNDTLLDLFDNILELNGKLVDFHRDWKSKEIQKGIMVDF